MTLSFSFKLQDVRTASPNKTGLLSTARRKFLTETVSTAIFKSVLQPKHLRVYPIYQFTLHRKCENTGFHESENRILAYFMQCQFVSKPSICPNCYPPDH